MNPICTRSRRNARWQLATWFRKSDKLKGPTPCCVSTIGYLFLELSSAPTANAFYSSLPVPRACSPPSPSHALISGTSAVVHQRPGKRRARSVAETQPHERFSPRIIQRPTHLARQPSRGIPHEARPRPHHVFRRSRLSRRIRQAGHVLGGPEDHVQVAAVVGAAAGVEFEIRPDAEVAETVHGDAMLGASGGFGGGSAGEAYEVTVSSLGQHISFQAISVQCGQSGLFRGHRIRSRSLKFSSGLKSLAERSLGVCLLKEPLFGGQCYIGGGGTNAIPSVFVVAVANQVGLVSTLLKMIKKQCHISGRSGGGNKQTYNPGEGSSCGQDSIVSEYSYIVNHGIKHWLCQQCSGERLDFRSCIQYCLEWLLAHAVHHV